MAAQKGRPGDESSQSESGAVSSEARPSEAFLRLITENLGDVALQIDTEGLIRYVSPSCRRVLGYEQHELLGERGDAHVDPDDLTAVRAQLDASRSSAAPVTLQYRFRRGDGRVIWLESTSRALLAPDGTHLGRLGVRRDITHRKAVEQDLLAQVRLEATVSGVAARFANAEPRAEATRAEIQSALEVIGEAVQADRAYVFRFSPDGSRMSNTHEWCAAGVAPESDSLQDLPSDTFPWWMERLSQGQSIDVVDVGAMPPAASAERDILAAQGIKSVLVVPMHQAGRLVGFLGFDAVSEQRQWSSSQLSLLQIVAGLIAAATERAEAARRQELGEQLLRESEQRYERLTVHSDAIIFTLMFSPIEVVYINAVAERLFGYAPDELRAAPRLGIGLIDFGSPGRRRRLLAQILRGRTVKDEILLWRTRDGGQIHIEHTFVPLRDEAGKVIGLEGIGRDVTERLRLQARIESLSLQDLLTGLANRACFERRLRELDKPDDLPISIIIADLNGLKLLNDTLGHEAGDRLLQTTAQVIRKTVRSQDVVARLGGDEFGVILPGVDARRAATVANRFRAALAEMPPELVPPSIAWGVGTKADPEEDIRAAQREAEDRMYHQKAQEAESIQEAIIAGLEGLLERRRPDIKSEQVELERLAGVVGQLLGLPSERQSELRVLARVRDLGQVALPQWLWGQEGDAPGRAARARALFEQHPEYGYRIAKAIPRLAPLAEAILAHHERWDGTGFPRGLKERSISQLARAWAVVATYWRGGPDLVRRQSGTQLDPRLVERFLKRLPGLRVVGKEGPPGSDEL